MCLEQTSAAPMVLVADDDPDLVALVARRLRKAGYKVITASDGKEALQMAKDFLPDLAVLDVMMPRLTGIDVIERLRAIPATHNMPVILVSAGVQDDVTVRGFPGGADDYIKKPFLPQELPSRVQAILARGRSAGPRRALRVHNPIVYVHDVDAGEHAAEFSRSADACGLTTSSH